MHDEKLLVKIEKFFEESEKRLKGFVENSIKASESRLKDYTQDSIKASESRLKDYTQDSIKASEERLKKEIRSSENGIADFIEKSVLTQIQETDENVALLKKEMNDRFDRVERNQDRTSANLLDQQRRIAKLESSRLN